MWIKIEKLTLTMLEEKMESFILSLAALKWDPNTDPKKMIEIFKWNQNYETVLVAIDEDSWEIIWNMRALCIHNYIRGWAITWRIEEIVVASNQQWRWVWSKLIAASLEHFKESGCYKVTLASEDHNRWFYEKFGFEALEVEMKMYC